MHHPLVRARLPCEDQLVMQGSEDARTTSSRPSRRPGRRVKLAVLLALVAPGSLADALTARAGVWNVRPQKVVIGHPHHLSVGGNAYVRCNDPGCGGSTQHPVPLGSLQLAVELSFKPDTADRTYTFNVIANDGSRFVPPLSGRITLIGGKLTEKGKSDIRDGASGRCDDLEILDDVDMNSFQVNP